MVSKKIAGYSRLVIILFFAIWLFIQSPLNPVYSECSDPEKVHLYLTFTFWILSGIFLAWMLYCVNRRNFYNYSTGILVWIYFLFLTFFTFFGVDFADPGFSLSKQWAMYQGMWRENFDSIAGTNLIGGLWLLIPGKPLLLWAKMGFVILQTSILYVTIKILLLYFKPKQVFLPVLSVGIFIAVWHYYMTINYDNTPFLVYLTSVYFILKGMYNEKRSKLHFIVSGVLVIISIFCKVTYLPAIILSFLLIYLRSYLFNDTNAKNKAMNFFIGLMIGTGIVILFLYISGVVDTYFRYFFELAQESVSYKDVAEIHSQNHSVPVLFRKYKDDLLSILKIVPFYITVILLLSYLIERSRNKKIFNYVLIAFSGYYIYSFTFTANMYNQFSRSSQLNVVSLFTALLVIWIVFERSSVIKKYLLPVIMAISVFIISFIGSDLSIRAAYHANSLLLFFSFVLIIGKGQIIKVGGISFKMNIIIPLTILLIVTGLYFRKDNIFRDANFQFLKFSFSSSSLIGINSTPQRVQVVDSLLDKLNTIPDLCKKKVLYTNDNALMYYLTDTDYLLGSPWDFLEDYYYLEKKLDKLIPDLIVTSKRTHRTYTWPLETSTDPYEKNAKIYNEFYDSFIKENNYVEVYKNSFYTVYGLEDKGVRDEQSAE